MKHTYATLFAACFFCTSSLSGQDAPPPPSSAAWRDEISFHVGGGLSTFSYRLSQGKLHQGFGGDVGAGYAYFFSERFGVNLGAGLSLFSATAGLSGAQSVIPDLVDEYGDRYELRTSFVDYSERQQGVFLRIPAMLHYRNRWLYVQAGVGASFPVNVRYESRNATLRNEAYYPEYGVSVTSPSFVGLGEFSGRSTSGKLSANTVYAALAEVGIRWQPKSPSWALYTGVYVDYGLNDAAKTHATDILRRSDAAPGDFTTGSVLSAHHAPEAPFTGKASLLAAGLRLRIALRGSAKPAVQPPAPAPALAPASAAAVAAAVAAANEYGSMAKRLQRGIESWEEAQRAEEALQEKGSAAQKSIAASGDTAVWNGQSCPFPTPHDQLKKIAGSSAGHTEAAQKSSAALERMLDTVNQTIALLLKGDAYLPEAEAYLRTAERYRKNFAEIVGEDSLRMANVKAEQQVAALQIEILSCNLRYRIFQPKIYRHDFHFPTGKSSLASIRKKDLESAREFCKELADFLDENAALLSAAGKSLDVYVVALVQGFADLAPGRNQLLSENRAKTAGQVVAKNIRDAGKDAIKIYPCSNGYGVNLPSGYSPDKSAAKTLNDPNRRIAQSFYRIIAVEKNE
jgi:hypothetical protein